MPPKVVSKKRARAELSAVEGPFPFIFISPGLKPDTRLKVFRQEFHVHSLILKLHSNFFRKFLDSPDKADGPASALLQYECISVVDDDGMWALEPAAKATVNGKPFRRKNIFGRSWTPENEADLFRKFLCAMYNRPYRLENIDELSHLTQLADFYCALPIISATLSGALLGSSMFKIKIVKTDLNYDVPFNLAAPMMIFEARKLRHLVLWADISDDIDSDPDHESDIRAFPTSRGQLIPSDPILTSLVKDEFIKLCRSVMNAFQSAMHCSADSRWTLPEFDPLKCPEQNAEYFTSLQASSSKNSHRTSFKYVKEHLDELLKNNLVLDQSGMGPGKGVHQYQLLCSNIADEDMPWDATEVDW